MLSLFYFCTTPYIFKLKPVEQYRPGKGDQPREHRQLTMDRPSGECRDQSRPLLPKKFSKQKKPVKIMLK